MNLDHAKCYEAVERRDSSYDGRFYTCVKTTGVYCKPSCHAKTPLSKNVEFVANIEEAKAAGFRACKKCKPRELAVV